MINYCTVSEKHLLLLHLLCLSLWLCVSDCVPGSRESQLSSVAQSCLTLCGPMDCSTPGVPVHHQLLEFAQTPVHRVGHPTISSSVVPSPPASNLSQHQGLSQWVSSLHRVAKVWSFSFNISPSNKYSGLISFRIEESSPRPQFKSINSLALRFLYSPTLTSIHDYWKNQSFD